MSWRDCPMFRVLLNGKIVARGIGDKESAFEKIRKLPTKE